MQPCLRKCMDLLFYLLKASLSLCTSRCRLGGGGGGGVVVASPLWPESFTEEGNFFILDIFRAETSFVDQMMK